jgi:hypothetical protein
MANWQVSVAVLCSGLVLTFQLESTVDAQGVTQSVAPADLSGVWEHPVDFRAPRQKAAVIPYVAAYQTRYEQRLKQLADGKFDQGGLCTPPGMPQILSAIGQFEILNTPGRMTILYEYQSQIRRIYMNRRKHAPEVDVTMNGDSIGYWEGKSLVIDTTQLKDFSYLNSEGGPHSDQLHIRERLEVLDANDLIDHVVVEDPVAFKSSWAYDVSYRRIPKGILIDYECNENPRNPFQPEGSLGFTLEGGKTNEGVPQKP